VGLDYPFARERKAQLPCARSERALLRPAGFLDLEALQRIEGVCFQRRRFRKEQLEWVLRNERALTLVEDDGRRLTGALMLLFEGRVCRVLSVAVIPEARRRELGTRLMLVAEDLAHDRGCSTIRLEVSTQNVGAIELYRTLEYVMDGLLPGYYSWGEDAFSMHKSLAAPPPPEVASARPTAEQNSMS